jgi:cation:H+ antiporter
MVYYDCEIAPGRRFFLRPNIKMETCVDSLLSSIIVLIASLGVILVAAILFTNGVEWLGWRLNLGHGAVGSVFAAVGTAMPETILPVVAVVLAGQPAEGRAVGMGAILGAPFMLSTLAMFVIGIAIIIFHLAYGRSLTLNIHWRVIGRDVRSFLAIYILALATAFIPVQPVKYAVAVIAVIAYVVYVHRHITDEEDIADKETPGPVYCDPWSPTPRMLPIALQIVVSLALMIGAAKVFVDNITVIGDAFNVSSLVIALIIAPIATELPEKLNSVVWARCGKDTLAMGNITGAMVFQSTIPVSFGMLFTNWSVDPSNISGFISAGVAILSCVLIFGVMTVRKRITAPTLLIGGVCYLGYLLYLLLIVVPSGASIPQGH